MAQASAPESGIRSEVFACDGPVEVEASIRSGLLDVRARDVPGVRVQLSIDPKRSRASGGGASDADSRALDECEVSFSDARRRLRVRTPRGFRRIGIRVHVEVPEESRVTARLHSGSVTTSGALTGLRAATGSGDVRSELVNGDVEAATGSGDLSLGRVTGRLRARSGSGRIEVDGVEGEGARLTTASGDVQLGVVETDVQARTGSGRVVVSDAARGRLDLVTGSGDVAVGVRPGVAAEIDLASGTGHARSELDVADRPPAEAPAVRVRARTGSGDAVVSRAGG